jgi:hypothetical protein
VDKTAVQIRRPMLLFDTLWNAECLFAVHRSYGDNYLVILLGLVVQFIVLCHPILCNHMNEEELCMLFYSFVSTCTALKVWWPYATLFAFIFLYTIDTFIHH